MMLRIISQAREQKKKSLDYLKAKLQDPHILSLA